MEFEKFSPPRLPKNLKSNNSEFRYDSCPIDRHFNSPSKLVHHLGELQLDNESQLFQTPKNNKSSRKSTVAAYQRVFTKYSPSTETVSSPLKASQVNLQNVIMETSDTYIDISIWVVNLSEQFFYDNTLLLLNGSKTNTNQMKLVIRSNSKPPDVSFFEKLENIIYLGKGAFGKVYSCTDLHTQTRYAIKYITPDSKDFVNHCKQILNYMAERNSIIRAMNSPFVVKFFFSFQTKSVGGLFLFFEYCIGDLYTFITQIAHGDYSEISYKLENNNKEIIMELDKNIDVLDVSLLYIFELFCGLDFLVHSNIVHQDIKPDNLMISETLHLKIADFGLVYRTRTIHRRSNKLLVNHNDIDKAESSNYHLYIEGTYYYQDFEIKLMELDREGNPMLDEVLENNTLFDTPGISYDDDNLKPVFLTDTWAAGIVSINLLFRGFDLFDPDLLENKNLTNVPQSNSNEFLVHLVGRQCFYKKYIYQGLINAGGECHRELMEFLSSIFQPRPTRSSNFVKEKTIYHFTEKRSMKYIDMYKIEQLKSFRDRNFSCSNIFLFTVPEKIRKYFPIRDKAVFPTFKNLLRGLSRITCGEEVIDLTPGLVINYFH